MSKSNKAATAAKVATMETADNYGVVITNGNKAAKVGDKVYKYLNDNLNAAAAANTLNTLQVSYTSLIKEFGVWNKEKTTLSAASMDIFNIFFNACHKIAKETKDTAARIPLLKCNADNIAAACLVTVKSEFYSQWYETADKAADKRAAAAEKAKETKAAKAAEKAAKETIEKATNAAAIPIDTAAKATAEILLLLSLYGKELDTAAIKAALNKLVETNKETAAA